MAHLTYYNYKGVGEKQKENFWYSQAVRVGDRIECSGQGGWDPATFEIKDDLIAEIEQAFANVDLALRTAGGKGWEQVFSVRSYHVDLGEEAMAAMVSNFKKHMPGHQPIWTLLGIAKLGEPKMRVEIEVVAHDPK